MKSDRSGPLSKFRAFRLGMDVPPWGFAYTLINVPIPFRRLLLDVEQATRKLWFRCKRLNRKIGRALGVTRPSVRLPQELVHQIVGYISDDRPTLFACTHLSRTWCIAARIHLHRDFTVLDSEGFKAADDLQSMGMIDLVRKIAVSRQIHQADFLLPETMIRLHTFTNLQELDIRYLNVGQPLQWLREHCDILKSTVRTLTLRYPRGSIKQLLSFISLFTSLENLAVDSIDRDFTTEDCTPVLETSPPLTGRLTLTGIFDQDFMAGLVSSQKGIKFRTVDLQFCGEAQVIVDGCAGTMERFIFQPSDFRGRSNSMYFTAVPADVC